ncbi:rRNA-processing protein utp23 [Mycena sanguinolenta]|uniref:U three protein 23 n=1 Tax=Mycena sanguinolenta TaxID=230812 RepID=A0A8H7CKW3_9AGAR|nr:rRNA-processing protein utp23 [Mycena sanguinolenta]
MRQKRAKAYRKLMALYSMSFGFRQPYQVLVDSEMCKEATEHKIELVKQLNSVLQGDMKPMITQCCIHELYLLGKTQQPAVDLAKTFERRKCNHREPIPGDDCLTSVVGETNKHRYVVATQSQPLRVKLRTIPAVPIVHVNRSVMVLEPPSDATIRSKEYVRRFPFTDRVGLSLEQNEEQALHATGSEKQSLAPSASTEPPRKKKKGPKGPNPLSVKKKKVESHPPLAKDKKKVAVVGEKRKRDDTDDKETETRDQQTADSQQQDEPRRKKKRRRKAAEPVVDS